MSVDTVPVIRVSSQPKSDMPNEESYYTSNHIHRHRQVKVFYNYFVIIYTVCSECNVLIKKNVVEI